MVGKRGSVLWKRNNKLSVTIKQDSSPITQTLDTHTPLSGAGVFLRCFGSQGAVYSYLGRLFVFVYPISLFPLYK